LRQDKLAAWKEPETMDGEPEDWPVLNEVGEIVRGDARTSLTQWANNLAAESAEFRVAFDELIKAECDRAKIGWLLSALANAQGWQSISRERLRGITDDLKKAAEGVRRLFFSQLNHVLGLDSLKLEGELLELVRRAKELEPKAHGRRPMGRDLVRATLVHYVHEATGQFHDQDVAALISVAESLPIDSRFVEPDGKPPAQYTADAHAHWRGRPPCEALLDGPADAVRELLADMDRDLMA
jgi:hypothetical protein